MRKRRAAAVRWTAAPELALVLLLLFAGELAVRVGTEARRRRRTARALS